MPRIAQQRTYTVTVVYKHAGSNVVLVESVVVPGAKAANNALLRAGAMIAAADKGFVDSQHISVIIDETAG